MLPPIYYPHRYDPGERTLTVEDWDTGQLITYTFPHDESPISMAEALYKRAKKQKRAAAYVEPLLEESREQGAYVEEVGASLELLEGYREPGDLLVLRQIQVGVYGVYKGGGGISGSCCCWAMGHID